MIDRKCGDLMFGDFWFFFFWSGPKINVKALFPPHVCLSIENIAWWIVIGCWSFER